VRRTSPPSRLYGRYRQETRTHLGVTSSAPTLVGSKHSRPPLARTHREKERERERERNKQTAIPPTHRQTDRKDLYVSFFPVVFLHFHCALSPVCHDLPLSFSLSFRPSFRPLLTDKSPSLSFPCKPINRTRKHTTTEETGRDSARIHTRTCRSIDRKEKEVPKTGGWERKSKKKEHAAMHEAVSLLQQHSELK